MCAELIFKFYYKILFKIQYVKSIKENTQAKEIEP